MLRASRPTLLALPLLFVAGCEPDECDLELAYNISGVGNHAITWSAPSAECRVDSDGYLSTSGGLSTGTNLEWWIDGATFKLHVPGDLGPGAHLAAVEYRDSAGKTWYSSEGASGVPPSTCVATIDHWEIVDWVMDDHYRITGRLTCLGPLLDARYDDELASAKRLQFLQDVKFHVYVGKLGY